MNAKQYLAHTLFVTKQHRFKSLLSWREDPKIANLEPKGLGHATVATPTHIRVTGLGEEGKAKLAQRIGGGKNVGRKEQLPAPFPPVHFGVCVLKS